METCLGSHLSGSSKLIPEADALQILACSWIVWASWFVLMKMDLQPLSQMLGANLLPWVAHLCTSSLSLSSYARLWCSKAVLHVCWTHFYMFCPASSAEIATLQPVRSVRALRYTFSLSSPTCYLTQMSFQVMRYLSTSACPQPPDSVKIWITNLQNSSRRMSKTTGPSCSVSMEFPVFLHFVCHETTQTLT